MHTQEEITTLLSQMTLSEKIGQLLMVGFDGLKPTPEVLSLIRDGYSGGVILFARNVAEASQIRELTGTLQEQARRTNHGLPLLIAVDQEGGPVNRIHQDVTLFPGNMALGAGGKKEDAYHAGKAVARELAGLGINMNLAPVLDVNNNPENPIIGVRSFGEDPQNVAELGMAMIQGQRDGGVMSAAKHFPGFGDTTVDSHLELPLIGHDRERLNAVELVPFRAAIAHGVDCIMTTHAVFPAVEAEPGLPATLSAAVLTGLLREEMGFAGLIITDCLEMRAIANHYEVPRAAAMAVKAGADLVLVSHTYAWQKAAHEMIRSWVVAGEIPEVRIDEAVRRIITAKMSLLPGLEAKMNSEGPDEECLQEHGELARRIADQSITLVRNRGQRLPIHLDEGDRILVITFDNQLTMAEDKNGPAGGLAEVIAGYHPRLSQRVLPFDPDTESRDRVFRQLETERPAMIIVATQNASVNRGQAEIIRALQERKQPLVVVALRNPYDLSAFPDLDTYIVAYGCQRVTLEAVAKLLWGRISARGKLPVSLPGLYPAGFGMEDF